MILRAILALLDSLRSGREESRHTVFQARLIAGSSLLALVIATSYEVVAQWTGQYDQSSGVMAYVFMGAVGLMLVAMKLGAPVAVVAGVGIGVLGCYLFAVTLTTRQLAPEQLSWLVLLPGVTLAIRRPTGTGSPWPVVAASLAAIALGLLSIAAHGLGLTLDEPAFEPPLWARAFEYGMFMVTVCGLMLLYELSAREAGAELQQFRRLLSVCSSCKRVRDRGIWVPIQVYFAEHHGEENVYGLCPACSAKRVPRPANDVPGDRLA